MSTPTERQNLINSLIIDNATGQISPAKMREVLTALNVAIVVTKPSGISAVLPLSYNNFTNQFSISLATALQDGYISKEDWIKFNTASTAPQADKITIKHKGWFNGVKNTSNNIEVGDICQGWNADHTEFMEAGKYILLGNDQDFSNYEVLAGKKPTIYKAGQLCVFKNPANTNGSILEAGDMVTGIVEDMFINASYLGGDTTLLASFDIVNQTEI